MKPFADIHCHPTLHPFAFYDSGRKRKNSLWWDNPPKERQRNDKYPEFFQSSMPALARGNVRLAVASMYPIEQPWLDPAITGTGAITDLLAKLFTTHLPLKFINKVQSSSFNYFRHLKKEYDFLLMENGRYHNKEGKEWRYVLPGNTAEINRYKDDDSTIIIIPSIEGMHSLIPGNAGDINTGKYDLGQLLENVSEVKNWDHHPLYISFSHHFYNGLCGHARTIPDGISSFLIKQNVGMNEPFNDRGEEVTDLLLGLGRYKNEGKRILIDIKHMSVAARKRLYQKISAENSNLPDEERIPIIASHCGYSGFKTLSDAIIVPDTEPSKYKSSAIFNPWNTNLTDEDVINIFKSGGLIGVILDQRMLSGMKVSEEGMKFSKREIFNNDEKIVKFWTVQIAKNILGMVKAVVTDDNVNTDEKIKVWDILSIGSDFDGMINPVDSFIIADEFKDLRSALAKYMPGLPDFDLCAQGLSIDEILDKIMYDNALEFVLRNYH